MPARRYSVIAAAEPYLASLLKWTKRGAWTLLAIRPFGLTMDWLEPQFRVEHKAPLEEERRQEALAEQRRVEAVRAEEERREHAPEQAVSGSTLDGNVLRIEGYTGTLELTLTPEFTDAWERAGCDMQRANLSIMFRKWKYQHGDVAHTVILRSWSGRTIGKFSSLWGYHCG